ncbi:MAG: M20 family metallopeptidase [Acidimicrobiales bacterium]
MTTSPGPSTALAPDLAAELHAAARAHDDAVVELRRAIHADPELGLTLPRTQQRVLDALDGLGLDISLGETTTSIVADLDTGRPGPRVLLRADMDALPMHEDTDEPFRSANDGAAHACGHDAHTAMLVGAARILSEHRGELRGSVRFMFQPGEEGFHGARYMIDEGVLDGVDRAFAIHITPNIPAGMLATRPGPLMASADTFRVDVVGRGGHASSPHFCTDPIPAACSIVGGLQTMITRDLDVNRPGLLTVARIEAGTTTNVIPETATIEGTVRALDEASRSTIHDGIHRVATGIAAAHSCTCSVDIDRGYPVTVNHPGQSALTAAVARQVLGDRGYVDIPTPVMGAEDFSYVLAGVPGAMAFLGVCPADVDDSLTAAPIHSNRMRLNEDAMAAGVAMHAAMAMAGDPTP